VTDPFSVSSDRCTWQFCTANADLRHQRRGAQLCREHALFTWSIVEDEIRRSGMSPADLQAEREEQARAKEAERERIAVKNAELGTVYYLRVGDHIKIGFAGNLHQRLTAYPPGSVLLAVEQGSLDVEASRHREFADFLAAGREWFVPGARLMDHVASLAASNAHVQYSGWEKRPAPTRRQVA
jgi:hypothetical protein